MRRKQNDIGSKLVMIEKLTLACGVMFLISCESVKTAPSRGGDEIQTSTVMPVPGSRAGTGDGAVLLVADIQGLADDAELNCRWRVINQDTGKNYFLSLRSESTNIYSHLDPGLYKTGRLGCGIGEVWDVDNVFNEGFKIEGGRISYVGKLTFQFKSSGDLQAIHKAPRSESAQAMQPAVDQLDPKEVAAMPVISGFTGQAVTSAEIAAPERDGFDVFAKNLENPKTALAPLMSTLKECAKAEGDSAQIGRLEYVAVYQSGRFSEMKTRDAQGFSDRMRSCIERGLMAFHPKQKSAAAADPIEVRVRY